MDKLRTEGSGRAQVKGEEGRNQNRNKEGAGEQRKRERWRIGVNE